MEVHALYGSSGTGKSTSALLFAHNNNIPAIIDDGLLIYKGEKIAGTSAKYEKNAIRAVKRAIFHFKDHTEEVRKKIDELPITKILIIGTSEKMVRTIASKLNVGDIDYLINIEDIRSPREIKLALFVRKTQGKHVIPIPYVQVEQSFFKKMILRGIKIFSSQKEVIGETTVVHPNFQAGSITISPSVLKTIVALSCKNFPEVDSYSQIKIDIMNVPIVTLNVSLKWHGLLNITSVVEQLQEKIHHDFQQYLDIELFSVNISVTSLIDGQNERKKKEEA